jgi:hypothetical protein
MSPALPLGSWWTDHLQLPGYDPIATAGPSQFDPRAAEQALAFVTQLLPSPLSRWEAAIVLNLWGWRQADGRRRYATVYAEPYRQDALWSKNSCSLVYSGLSAITQDRVERRLLSQA